MGTGVKLRLGAGLGLGDIRLYQMFRCRVRVRRHQFITTIRGRASVRGRFRRQQFIPKVKGRVRVRDRVRVRRYLFIQRVGGSTRGKKIWLKFRDGKIFKAR